MRRLTLLLLCLVTVHVNLFSVVNPVIEYMKKNVVGPRILTFEIVLKMIEERQAKVIVETGTARGPKPYDGDGGFTPIFGYWCFLNNADLYSVDIDPQAVKNAKNLTRSFANNVHIFEQDSIHFLKEFDKPIDFLYLDSYDFDSANPHLSQEHHLKEIEAAYEKLKPHAIVMIDDCNLPYGGKGKLAIEFLVKRGWIIFAQDYQIIMCRMLNHTQ